MRASTPDKSWACSQSVRGFGSPSDVLASHKLVCAVTLRSARVVSLAVDTSAMPPLTSPTVAERCVALSWDEGRARRLASRERSCAKDRKHDNTRRIARVAAKKACREIAKLRRLREMCVASGTSRGATRAPRGKLGWKCTSRRKRLIKCSEIICCRQQRKIAIWRFGHFYF